MRIGLTGGIGSGKSTVAREWVALGATLIDTDAIAHALTGPDGAAMPALAAAFGPAVLAANGALDRAHMRQLVFADPAAKLRLEAVLHPMIGAETQRQAAAAEAAGATHLVFDVPLLTESRHWRARVDRVLVVDCDEAVQLQRVAARPGWTEAAAQAVIAQQATRAQRRAIADAVICNGTKSLEQLAAEVGALAAVWGLAAASGTPSGSGAGSS